MIVLFVLYFFYFIFLFSAIDFIFMVVRGLYSCEHWCKSHSWPFLLLGGMSPANHIFVAWPVVTAVTQSCRLRIYS